MAYDIVIKGGSVIDGTGSPMSIADVGIKNGLVAAVGAIAAHSGKAEISAAGKYVAPGFIDITNHSDTHLSLFSYPRMDSMLMQGVTTVIGGNCGSSLAPLFSPQAIAGISKWADVGQININWNSVSEFLASAELLHPGVNFGMYVGYGTLRRGILGDETRALTLEERERMKSMIGQSLDQGVFGLSIGLAYGHERVSSTEELIDIGRVCAGGRGVIKIHLRSEGKEILGAVNEAVRIGRETGAAVVISHFKVIGKQSWHLAHKALELIDYARSEGVRVSFDVSAYHTTGSPLYLLLPPWTRVGGVRGLFARIDSPEDRAKIIEDLKTRTLHYDRITVISAKQRSIVGRSVQEIADQAGMGGGETLLDILRANEGRVAVVGRTVSAKNTREALTHTGGIVSSDGFALAEDAIGSGNLTHPRSFGAFAHFWHSCVTDAPYLRPEEAIVKMTSLPAQTLGIAKRGILARGNSADVVIFDPRAFRDRATYKNPFRYPTGMEWVIVNGQIAVAQGMLTPARAGRILKKNHG